MRILIYSDLHLEFKNAIERFRVPMGMDFDAVILAGDIHKHTHGITWAAKTFAGKRIFYVMGNHEAYGAHLYGLMAEMRKVAKEAGVIFLEGDEWIDHQHGIRFLGTTLWTDFQLFGTGAEMTFAMKEAARFMPDFSTIRIGAAYPGLKEDNPDIWHSGVLHPRDTVKLFIRSRNWLAGKLTEPFDGGTVVVTHHLPSFASVAERFQKDVISAAFASRVDDLVERADLWIHGHTHDSMDYGLGKCRVVCNPRGYPDNLKDTVENREFRDDFIVEVN